MIRQPRRAALLAALAVATGACTGGPSASPTADDPIPPAVVSAKALAERVCESVSHEVLLRTWRGIYPGRSGDVQLIPEFPNFVNGGLTHATPFGYTQDVPLFLYAPGIVEPGVYDQAGTLADLAPTQGLFLKFDFSAPDGRPLTQAFLPEAGRPVPRLLVTLVWDSAGTDVLDRWPDDWPYLRSLLPQGAWFTRVTVGTSPSNTPTGHATIGTGAFPMRHGFVDEYVRVNGRIQKPNENGPGFLLAPTFADLYDRAMGNEPVVGGVATLAAHLMMMGHGSQWGGADSDIAITREKEFAPTAGAESAVWNLTPDMAPFYTLPAYANELPPITGYTKALDQADGRIDGKWRDNSIAQLSDGFDTPARTPYQTALIETLIEREGFGLDDVPDLLYLNYKAIDTIGHLFSADGVEMSDAIRWQDQALRELVEYLDRVVGERRWAMILTADHGTQRDPTVSGAFMIDVNKLDAVVERAFDGDGDGVPLIQRVRATEIWLDGAELEDNGHTLAQVSQLIMGLTQDQTYKNVHTPAPGRGGDTVFAAALPSSMLSRLPCLPEARAG